MSRAAALDSAETPSRKAARRSGRATCRSAAPVWRSSRFLTFALVLERQRAPIDLATGPARSCRHLIDGVLDRAAGHRLAKQRIDTIWFCLPGRPRWRADH